MVVDARSHMLELNSLSFTELRRDLLVSLRDHYEHEMVYGPVWKVVNQRRDPSPENQRTNEFMSTHGSSLSTNDLKCKKHFSIDQGYLLYKGQVCAPQAQKLGTKIFIKVI